MQIADPVLQDVLEAVERLRPYTAQCSIAIGAVKVEVTFLSQGTIAPLSESTSDDEDDPLAIAKWSSVND